ncbi:keratin, type II cytoskeletal 1-like [Saccostrea echinata]|uniref:keratin, type II cytoskeletal 1-like n=1 Tax=Saccostrea echinata TaxID=191078 RepID=UPI002A83264E|nr:keratin, type II cytoskeletal 1-like [Saccostrea echinata]
MAGLFLALLALLSSCLGAPFDPNAINQNFGSGGFGMNMASTHSAFDPNALNHGFGGNGFGGGFSTPASGMGTFDPNGFQTPTFDPNALNGFGSGSGNFDPNAFGKK